MTNRLSPFSFGSPPEALGSISPLFAYPPFRSYPATAHARSCAPRSPIAALGERGKHPKTSRKRRESRPNWPKRAPERAVSGSNGALVQGHNHKYHNDLDPRVWLHTPLPRLARSRARTRNLPCETHANSSAGCDRLQHPPSPNPLVGPHTLADPTVAHPTAVSLRAATACDRHRSRPSSWHRSADARSRPGGRAQLGAGHPAPVSSQPGGSLLSTAPGTPAGSEH
jgi:hypothetical protein